MLDYVTPSSKVCMSNVVPFGTTFLPYLELKFHLKHFPSYIYGEQVNNSIRLLTTSQTNETLLYDISQFFLLSAQ